MSANSHHHPYLHLILGPMFAEKSTTLLRNSRRFQLARQKCVLIKYQGDQRYTDKNYIATHDQILSRESAYPCHHLFDLESTHPELNLEDFDVICIDEIQFFPDSLEFCQKWRNHGKIIIACGLYADFKRKPFPNLPELIAISDKTEFLKAICQDCSRDAATTSYRLSDEAEQVVVGGAEKYLPLCQSCYERRHSLKTVS
jgi:thymidine kinase